MENKTNSNDLAQALDLAQVTQVTVNTTSIKHYNASENLVEETIFTEKMTLAESKAYVAEHHAGNIFIGKINGKETFNVPSLELLKLRISEND